MIKKSIFFILLALLLIMSGCGTNSQAPNSSASTSAPTESSGSAGSTQPDQEGFLTNQNEPLTHASALGLYESLDVSEDQRVEILDMNEDYIFLSVNYDAFEIELTREVGFTYMSEKLVLLEYPNMTLVSEILLPSAVYCTSGALFDDGYSYSTITISDSIESDYSIYYHSNQSEAPDALIDHGKCYAVDFNIPSLLTMDSGQNRVQLYQFGERHTGNQHNFAWRKIEIQLRIRFYRWPWISGKSENQRQPVYDIS